MSLSAKTVMLIKTKLGWYRDLFTPIHWSFYFEGGYYEL